MRHKVNISTLVHQLLQIKNSISLADDELIKKMYVNGDFVHIITNKQFIKIRKSNMSRTQVVNFGNSVLLDGDGENFHYEGIRLQDLLFV